LRQTIRDIRRTELIEAVISAIHAQGFANLTVTEIARNADTSAGSIHYYFGSKEALLEATMRHLLSILRHATVQRLKGVVDAKARLDAIITANFDEALFSRQNCSVWIQFWASAPYVPSLARLQRMNRSRVCSNLRRELRTVLPAAQVEGACASIQSYMDGIWINATQATADPVPATAQQEARSFLSMMVRERL
jgi:TetR/AcrR family transcriptional repressor of bet genes